MEGVVEGDGGDRSRGWPFRVGGKKEQLPSRLRLPRVSDLHSMLISTWIG